MIPPEISGRGVSETAGFIRFFCPHMDTAPVRVNLPNPVAGLTNGVAKEGGRGRQSLFSAMIRPTRSIGSPALVRRDLSQASPVGPAPLAAAGSAGIFAPWLTAPPI